MVSFKEEKEKKKKQNLWNPAKNIIWHLIPPSGSD